MPVSFWCAVTWLVGTCLAAAFANVLPLRRLDDPDFLLGAAVAEGHWTSSFGRSHLLGVDDAGNDLLSLVVRGARVSLLVGIGTVVFSLLLGGVLGLAAGYVGGRFDALVMFVTNGILSIPPLLFLLLLAAVMVGNGAEMTIWKFVPTLGVLFVPTMFRVVRIATIQHASREYVLAARSVGASRWRIVSREILPNVTIQALAFALVAFGGVIVVEGSLSFLGIGLGGGSTSWGTMIQRSAGLSKIQTSPHAIFVPAGFLFLTVLSVNLAADVVRDRVDPKKRVL